MPAERPATQGGGVILLAGGFGRRFGSDKRFYEVAPGQPMLLVTLAIYAAVYERVLVVVREADDELERLILKHQAGTAVVRCRDSDLGMGHTLACGIRAATGWAWASIALADMPFIQSSTLGALCEAFAASPAPAIVQPTYRDEPGHPVIFDKFYFAQLEGLTGDEGARSVLKTHARQVRRVAVDDAGVIRDLDMPPA